MTALPPGLVQSLRDRYRIERQLGRGGMATVYLAHDLKHDRPVALKVVHPELASSLGRERFLREIRTAARLQHPHILSVHDSGEIEPPPVGATQASPSPLLWFTMPYVEGESLRDRLRREGQLPLEEAVRITSEAARALDYAHAHGVIHRDVKPENILLARDGTTLVADFGIARALDSAKDPGLTETGIVVGTAAYMSPEQASGDRALDGRTDVYSLGCVLYEMLAGEPPFTGPSPQAVIAKRMSGPAPHVGTLREVPWEVERAVAKSLARSPADRFHAAGVFATALAGYDRSAAKSGRGRGALARWVATSVTAVTAGALIAWVVLSRPWETRRAESVAVLPFSNLSPDPANEYISDGITEELITALSRIPGLRVAARTSAFAFKGRNPEVNEVRGRLGVETVLAGSVRRSGDRLRVSAELVDARDGYRMWSDAYDREVGDAFAVQQELAGAIAAALRGNLTAKPTLLGPAPEPEAYDLYLRARHAFRQRTWKGLLESRDLSEQAIARDPGFARAHAALADVYAVLGLWSDVPPSETFPRAKAAALQALALDGTLPEPHAALGYVYTLYEWDWSAADRAFQRSLELDPNAANTWHWYAELLTTVGRMKEAVELSGRAREMDPLSTTINAAHGLTLYRAGRYAEAREHLEAAKSLDPDFLLVNSGLGEVLLMEGRPADAIVPLERAVDSAVRHSADLALLAHAYAGAGRRADAERLLEELRERQARDYVSRTNVGILLVALGDTAGAFAALERAAEDRDPFLAFLFASDPLIEGVRRHPRGEALLRRMGLRR